MEDNKPKEKKRLQSVSHAVQKIKAKEEEQRQQGIPCNDIPEDSLSKTEIVVPEAQEDEELVAQEIDEEDIDDESLYESSDSTFESLFLSKGIVKAEGVHSTSVLAQEVPEARLNTSTVQELKKIKKNLNDKITSKANPPEQDEMEELQEAEAEIAVVNEADDKKESQPKEKSSKEILPKEKSSKEILKSEKISKNSLGLKDSPSKEILLPEKPGEIRRDKSLMEVKEEAAKHFPEKKDEKKDISPYLLFYPVPAIFVLLAFVIVIVAIFFSSRGTMDTIPTVKTASVFQEDFEPVLSIQGFVASSQSHLYSQTQGTVAEILCKEGDFVRKGDPVIKLHNEAIREELQLSRQMVSQTFLQWQEAIIQWDSFRKKQEIEKKNEIAEIFSKKLEDFQKQFMAAFQESEQQPQKLQEKLSQQKLQWENFLMEYYKGLNPNQSKLLFLEWKYQTAYQEILASLFRWKQKEKESKSLVIIAPENGQIDKIFVSPGDPVVLGAKIARLILPGEKWIDAKIPYTYIPHLAKISKQELKADLQFPFTDFPSLKEESVLVSLVSFASQNLFTVQIKFVSDKPKLPDGTLAMLKIVLPVKQSCIQVARQSVVYREHSGESLSFVYVLSTEKEKSFLKEVPVVLGMTNEKSVEVLRGLTGQETIVLFSNLGIGNLFNEMMVRVCNEE